MPEIIENNNTERNNLIDLLKGISIIMIIITHCDYAWDGNKRLLFGFPFWIDMAVPIFMIISGYVYSLSINKREIVSFIQAYRLTEIWRKFLRYTVPFAIAFIMEYIAHDIIYYKMNFPDSQKWFPQPIFGFINGGMGGGSYYYPVMCQFILLFPLVYFTIKALKFRGLAILFVFNFLYELIKESFGIGDETYRLLVFRYLFLIGFGCWFCLYGKNEKHSAFYIFSFSLGLIWQILVKYGFYTPRVINVAWAGTSMFSAMYIIPVFVLIWKIGYGWKVKFLEIIGKASFHIFLTQMVYYAMAKDYVYNLVFEHTKNYIIIVFTNIIICCVLGICFYYIEKPIGKLILKITSPVVEKIEYQNEM